MRMLVYHWEEMKVAGRRLDSAESADELGLAE